VKRLLVEESVEIEKEFYLGMTIDRDSRRVALMASSEGGMDIEDVAARTPEKIRKLFIDPATGVKAAEADGIARDIGFSGKSLLQVRTLVQNLYQAFDACDASLAEINPLALTRDGRVMALDAKFNFDPNALFRQPEIAAMRDLDEEDPAEVEASKFDLSYIPLDGDIGCLVNGAGLAMATMDAIKLYGGSPANFLDVGGGASAEKVTEAFKLMLRNPNLRAILVNIFGGIMKCDVIARGIVAAAREVQLSVPLVVRMKGTNEDLGKKILRDSGLPIISADNMADAAKKVVAAVKKAKAKSKPKPRPRPKARPKVKKAKAKKKK
jgi:succinyl-CoA synthetase beta subunit